MARGRAGGIPGRGENIIHFGALRLVLIGEGNLQLNTYGLNDVLISSLRDVVLSPSTDVEPTRLMNIKKQRMSFEFKVTEINEWFIINKLIIYTKPIYSQGPNLT
jgi:hypothetical protein